MITIDYKRLNLKKDDRLLDLGCGEGRHILAALRHESVYCTGVDLNEANLALVKEKLNKLKIPDGYVPMLKKEDATNLSFGCNHFDTVICSEVLEHIDNYKAVIKQVNRVLKPNGGFVVSVPRTFPESICWLLSDGYHNVPGGHIRIFKANQLKKIIESCGFRHYDSHFSHAFHTPFWWLKCFFWDKQDEKLSIKNYEKWLIKQLYKYPDTPRFLERLLNPILGKSVVMYFNKQSK